MFDRHPPPVFVAATTPGDCLVILLHGCTWTPRRRKTQLEKVLAAVQDSLPGADVLMPVMPIEFWSLQNPDSIVSDIIAAVDGLWRQRADEGRPYGRTVMVGFSFGSVLLRQLFCRGAGAREDGTIDPDAVRPWARSVERMILLAGLNRGWTVDSPVTRIESFFNNIGTAIGHLIPRKPTLFAIRRGAAFLTRTRLQWLALEAVASTPPLTVQLLGTRDDIVSPVDSIDLATGSRFVYLEVPESGHFDVVDVAADTRAGAKRRETFQRALIGDPDDLRAVGTTEQELLQLLPVAGDPSGELALRVMGGQPATHVVFVVHGIRDKGYWTHKIARVVVSHGRQRGHTVVAVAPTYGYFAMLPFLLPWTRRAKIEWLLDMYVAVRCWHPQAAVSFIGHSNGTYIVAGAVKSCPAVHFDKLLFAGSVVPSGFDWKHHVDAGQVRGVVNYVATADWVVAIFPKFFQMLRLQDLGSAGHDGFRTSPTGNVVNVTYVSGRHSAALDEQHWQDIAGYVIDGVPPRPRARRRSAWVAAAGYGTPLIWLLLATMALAPLYLILTALGLTEVTGVGWVRAWQKNVATQWPAWLWAGLLISWMQVLRLVLTRF